MTQIGPPICVTHLCHLYSACADCHEWLWWVEFCRWHRWTPYWGLVTFICVTQHIRHPICVGLAGYLWHRSPVCTSSVFTAGQSLVAFSSNQTQSFYILSSNPKQSCYLLSSNHVTFSPPIMLHSLLQSKAWKHVIKMVPYLLVQLVHQPFRNQKARACNIYFLVNTATTIIIFIILSKSTTCFRLDD